MSPPIESRIVLETARFEKGIDKRKAAVMPALLVGVKAAIFRLVRHVTTKKLQGQVLNRVTGTLIRSIAASPSFRMLRSIAVGTAGTRLGYGAKHEFGGTFQETVSAHARREHMRSTAGGASVRVRAHQVRAHQVRKKYRARRYFRQSVTETKGHRKDRYERAVAIAMKQGRVPTLSELR